MRISGLTIALALLVLAACDASRPVSSVGPAALPPSNVAVSTSSGTTEPAPTPSPTPVTSTTAAPSVSLDAYPDGIPRTLTAQMVHRTTGAMTIASDDEPFLIGGWTAYRGVLCPSESTPPGSPSQLEILAILSPRCAAGPTLGESIDDPGLWFALRNPAGLSLPNPGAVVLRVHAHDPRAALCPEDRVASCDAAIVIDAVVWRRDGPPPSPALGPVAASLSVGEFVAARDAGVLPDGPIELHGYWSFRLVGHSCAAPLGPTGELEIYCHDGEFGITERDEPIVTYERVGLNGTRGSRATGPAITPFIPNELFQRLAWFGPKLPIGGYLNGLWPLPIPISVVGHVHDPRAAQCRASAAQLCRDRFVIDRIVTYDPAAVATPSPSPSPTPFPSPAPPAAFTKASCHGNVPYSFMGWAPLNTLGIGDSRSDYVYAMVTRDAVALNDWQSDQKRPGHKWRVWGRGLCWGDGTGVILFDTLPGTAFRLYDDGVRDLAK